VAGSRPSGGERSRLTHDFEDLRGTRWMDVLSVPGLLRIYDAFGVLIHILLKTPVILKRPTRYFININTGCSLWI